MEGFILKGFILQWLGLGWDYWGSVMLGSAWGLMGMWVYITTQYIAIWIVIGSLFFTKWV